MLSVIPDIKNKRSTKVT